MLVKLCEQFTSSIFNWGIWNSIIPGFIFQSFLHFCLKVIAFNPNDILTLYFWHLSSFFSWYCNLLSSFSIINDLFGIIVISKSGFMKYSVKVFILTSALLDNGNKKIFRFGSKLKFLHSQVKEFNKTWNLSFIVEL